MKNNLIKFLGLGVLSISLIACNKGGGGGDATTKWTDEENAIMDDVFFGYHLPYLASESTTLSFFEDDYAVMVDATNVSNENFDKYLTKLTDSGLTYFDEIEGTKVYELDTPNSYVAIQITHVKESEEAKAGDVFIYGLGSYISETFPKDFINELMEPYGIDKNYITFEEGTLYQVDRSYYSYGIIDVYCTTEKTAQECFAAYKGIAESKGYTVTPGAESLPEYTDEAYTAKKAGNNWNVEANYDADYGTFDIAYVYNGELGGDEGTSEDTNTSEPEVNVEPNDFDFMSKAQLTSATNDVAIWTSGEVTFKVEIGSSATGVGNVQQGSDFLTAPLRIYGGQVVTLTVANGKTFDNVVFDIELGSKCKIEHFTTATWTGVSTEIEQLENGPAMMKVKALAGATSISFTPSKQVHINSIDVTLAA